jgi:hypothetical protein
MINIILINIFDSKIVDNDGERYMAGFMVLQPRGVNVFKVSEWRKCMSNLSLQGWQLAVSPKLLVSTLSGHTPCMLTISDCTVLEFIPGREPVAFACIQKI